MKITNGNVSFDATNLNTDDPGVELMQKLTTAQETIIYTVSDQIFVSQQTFNDDEVPLENQRTEPKYEKIKPNGITNLSIFPEHNIIPGGVHYWSVPGAIKVQGNVIISGNAKWEDHGSTLKPRASVVFHELWENYERTVNRQFYSQAHAKAIDAELRFKSTLDPRCSNIAGYGNRVP